MKNFKDFLKVELKILGYAVMIGGGIVDAIVWTKFLLDWVKENKI